jgi:hypothetical protein
MTSILPIFEVLQGLVNFSCFLHSTSEGNEPLRGPSSRRPRKPIILGAEPYFAVPDLLPEPYRTHGKRGLVPYEASWVVE